MSSGRAQFPRETSRRGAFERQESVFRRWVSSEEGAEFPAEPGRYHLYVSLACPWAHRTVIARRLKGLEDVIGMSVVDPIRDERGWAFTDAPGCGPDPVQGFRFLSEAYAATDPDFDGRVTVPVLWDKRSEQIVNNESSEVLRMLNRAFDAWGNAELDLYPVDLRPEIDAVNERVYRAVNNGVYRCGFATTQEAYEEAYEELFDALAWLEARLRERRYLCGDRITEADWRLFTTLLRFDPVYHLHFKCNRKRLVDHPALWGFARELYQVPGIAGTVDFDHICRHYFLTHPVLNPLRILPGRPEMDWDRPHGRENLV